MTAASRPAPLAVAAAFAAIYLIWGSTYLGIRVAIETIPPFLMAGTRFLVPGAVLYAWARWRGAARPSGAQWRAAATIGALLLLGGNGGVTWAEQRVPSGVTCLLITTVPIWMVVLESLRPGGSPPHRRVLVGTALGFAGLAILLGPEQILGGGRIDFVGAGVLVLASLSWSVGSLASRRAELPASAALATAMEMLAGGALLAALGIATGEPARLDPRAVTGRSAAALAYLSVFGSLVALSAYIWLLKVSTPARVSTYAYVNPVVAVLLGAAVAGEPLTPRVGLAAMVILAAVALVVTSRAREGTGRRAGHETRSAEPAEGGGSDRRREARPGSARVAASPGERTARAGDLAGSGASD